MARGKKFGGKDWVKGQSGNPNGRPKLPDDVKEAKKYTRGEVELLLAQYGKLTTRELVDIAKNPDSKGFDAMVASILAYGIKKGDPMRANFFLDRTIGKAKDHIEVDVDGAIEVVVKDYRGQSEEE